MIQNIARRRRKWWSAPTKTCPTTEGLPVPETSRCRGLREIAPLVPLVKPHLSQNTSNIIIVCACPPSWRRLDSNAFLAVTSCPAYPILVLTFFFSSSASVAFSSWAAEGCYFVLSSVERIFRFLPCRRFYSPSANPPSQSQKSKCASKSIPSYQPSYYTPIYQSGFRVATYSRPNDRYLL